MDSRCHAVRWMEADAPKVQWFSDWEDALEFGRGLTWGDAKAVTLTNEETGRQLEMS